MTKKDKAIKKIEIAIDKMIDLQDDFIKNIYAREEIKRILDTLNSFNVRIQGLDNKKDFFK